MICPDCNIEKPIEDFLGKLECFKCGYAKKIKEYKELNPCKICHNKLPKGRWKYCGKDCAKKGKNLHNRNYWTSNIRGERKDWKEFRF